MTTSNLSRRLLALESTTADAGHIEVPAEDFVAGRLPRGWNLYKAIRASYGYDPDGAKPIGPQQQSIWQGATA